MIEANPGGSSGYGAEHKARFTSHSHLARELHPLDPYNICYSHGYENNADEIAIKLLGIYRNMKKELVNYKSRIVVTIILIGQYTDLELERDQSVSSWCDADTKRQTFYIRFITIH